MKTNRWLFKSRSGIALVMTIMILAMITVMVLGFADLVRYETVSASSHQDRTRAQFFSQMGVDTVTGLLKKQTANPDLVWASKPGALIIPTDAKPGRLSTQVSLHSGYPSANALATYENPESENNPATNPQAPSAILAPANLNIQTLADQNPPTHLITDQSVNSDLEDAGALSLPIRWVYVREDGTLDYEENPVIGIKTNPLVGRYAYWTDDESSKININTAWKRNAVAATASDANYNTFPSSHPTAINLSSLNDESRGIVFDTKMADFLHSFITANHKYSDLGTKKDGHYGKFFNSLYEVRAVDEMAKENPDLEIPDKAFTKALNAYKFELTHFNHDPDSTFFNEPRIVLTTQRMYAQGRPFIDILKDPPGGPQKGKGAGTLTEPGADPGRTEGNVIDYAKLNKVVKKLVEYMKRNDWPMVTGTSGKPSLQKKYFGNDDLRLTQIALNLIDYVRSAESKYLLVEPFRGIISKGQTIGSKFYPKGDFISDIQEGSIRGQNLTYKGITRSLYVSEMGVWVADAAEASGVNAGRFRCKFFVELHLPAGNGIDEIDLTNLPLEYGESSATTKLWVYNRLVNEGGDTYKMSDGINAGSKWWLVKKENIVSNLPVNDRDPVIKEGGYKTLQFEVWRKGTGATFSIRPVAFNGMRFALAMEVPKNGDVIARGYDADPGTQRFEVSPISGGTVAYTANNPGTLEGDIRSMATDDPFINNVTKDWKNSSPRHTLANLTGAKTRTNPAGITPDGPANADVSSIGDPPDPSFDPPQDVDKNNKVTGIGIRFPYPKGHPKNPFGMVYSAGELGFLHTGVQIDDIAPTGGVPYRSLRLQYSLHDNTTVPDWAFMDLFTAPVHSAVQAQAIFTPHQTGVGGRVNINAQVEPYADPSKVDKEENRLIRRLPLVAVLADAPCSTTTSEVIKNTQVDPDDPNEKNAVNLAKKIYHRRWKSSSASRRFGHPDAFDSPGEIVEIEGIADGGEDSEALMRSIGSLITTRGSVFTVYSIGQTLRETRNNELLVSAEQRHQTTLERYLEINDNGTPDVYTDDEKKVRFRKVSTRNLTP